MKCLFILLSYCILTQILAGQPFDVDSLRKSGEGSAAGANQVRIFGMRSSYHNHNHPRSGLVCVKGHIGIMGLESLDGTASEFTVHFPNNGSIT